MIFVGIAMVAGGGGGIAAASPREGTPDSDISTSSLMSRKDARLPATNWDPAKQLLLLMGMEPLPMVPGWEFANTVSTIETGLYFVCTTSNGTS